jgi:hypothetical protein
MNQKFKVGEKIYHDVYGNGVIKEIVPDYTGDTRYEVEFSRYPHQTLSVMGDSSLRRDNKLTDKKKGENASMYFGNQNKAVQEFVENLAKAGANEKDFAKILADKLGNGVCVIGGVIGDDDDKEEEKQPTKKASDNEKHERKLTVDGDNNVVGGAIFGNPAAHTDKVEPMFCAAPVSRKAEPDNVARHRKIVMGLNELYAKKNADYGDSFHDTYLEEGMAMARIRLSDKLSRFKSLTKSGQQNVKDESIRDTLLDLANYAIMTVLELDREGAKVG